MRPPTPAFRRSTITSACAGPAIAAAAHAATATATVARRRPGIGATLSQVHENRPPVACAGRRRRNPAILTGMPGMPAVHPLQPRFAQGITGVLALEAAIFDQPAALAVALALVLLSLLGPRWSPVAWLFRRIAPPARDLEPAAPVRFSQGIAAVFLAVALALVLAGQEVAGWALAGLVAAIALVSAITGFCIGCEA